MAEDNIPASRRHPRAPIVLKVQYKKFNSFFSDYTRNISKGGMGLKTNQPAPIGTRFLFRLFVPTREEPFELSGEVMWCKTEGEDAGMGIQFVYANDLERSTFEAVVEKMMEEKLGPQVTAKLLNKSAPDQ
jgi:type IV pilus assembly protein PilZ